MPFQLCLAAPRQAVIGEWSPHRLVQGLGAILAALMLLLIGVVRHVQGRRAAEALRTSEEYNRALLAAIPDLIFVLDRAGRFVNHKAGSQQLLMPPERFPGQSIERVLPAELAGQLRTALNRFFISRQPQTFDYRLTIDHRTMEYESRLVGFGEDKVLAIAHDYPTARWILGEHGCLVDTADGEATARALRAALAGPGQPTPRHAAAAARFDWPAVAALYTEFLSGIAV